MTNDNDNHNNDNKNYRVLKKWLGWREAQGWDEMCLDICRRTGEQPGCKRVCLQHRTGPPAASDALKDTTTQQGPWWLWNPLRNYSVAVSHEFPRTEADDNARPPTNYEINLGEFLDRAGLKAEHVAKASFEATKGYVQSWKDGNQMAFFRRVYELATDRDQLQVLREHAKKTIDLFWNGRDGKKKNDNDDDDDDKKN